MRKVGWFDIYVEDMERAKAFYEAVLDTTLTSLDDPNDPTAQMPVFDDDFTSHGAGGALVKLDHAKPGPGGSMVYFSCDDCAVEEARVPAAGGSVVRPKFSIGAHGFVSIVADTEGNLIGLHSVTPQDAIPTS
jgi:predicted enzyme related to lactoylglutathione lyase